MTPVRPILALALLGLPGSLAAQSQAAGTDSVATAELLQRPEVARYLRYFTGPGRDRMSQWLTRGTRYRSLIASGLEREGLPADFGFLPIIESGFSPTAVSRAGAAGIWQFIPETARAYGLRVDDWVDERRDPDRATDAAVRHIRDLRRTFGDPLLAAAAYNGGTGRVSRGLARLADSTRGFFSLAQRGLLAEETRNYVPQFLAAAEIGRNPDRYGFAVDSLERPAVDSVRVDRAIDLTRAERALGLDRTTLAGLNPHFFRGVTPPGGSWLRIPAGFGADVTARLAALPSVVLARHERRAAALGALVWVKRGETVRDVARRHGVTEGSLRRINALPAWYRLRPGQALRLPAAGTA
ncbi:MAG: transglycosylase SLT domain-containing protein [Gemmatimonadales bacterium]|nr:transglycosylase SLT domain-containing protein [Gemmatimonadales bacterium]